MNQNLPSQPLYTQHQLLEMASNAYTVATQAHLNILIEEMLTPAPLDQWVPYLTSAIENLAQHHHHPAAFLAILSSRLAQAAHAHILAA